MRESALGLAAVLALAGCAAMGVRDESAVELERNFQDSDRKVRENRTFSALAEMETSLAGYLKHEKRIPAKLEQLIPKYLADIPSIDLGTGGHRETHSIRNYSSDILRDGQIDGTRIRDTGRWGYVYNERQVVVFVDCTHPSSRGKPWYQERASP